MIDNCQMYKFVWFVEGQLALIYE